MGVPEQNAGTGVPEQLEDGYTVSVLTCSSFGLTEYVEEKRTGGVEEGSIDWPADLRVTVRQPQIDMEDQVTLAESRPSGNKSPLVSLSKTWHGIRASISPSSRGQQETYP